MRFHIAVLGLCLCCTGCTTHRFLGRNVTKQSSTLTSLIEQQVLDNVAAFVAKPDSLPHFAVIGDGTSQAQDGGFLHPGMTWNATTFTGANLPIQGSRQLMQNWKLQPVMTAGRVRRMRCAYQLLFNRPHIRLSEDGTEVIVDSTCIHCIHELVQVGLLRAPCGANVPTCPTPGRWAFNNEADAKAFLESLHEDIDCNIPSGWFCYGRNCDVPKYACTVGTYCDMRAWVVSGGEDAFARFTLTVLALATLDPPPAGKADDLFIRQMRVELLTALGDTHRILTHIAEEKKKPESVNKTIEIDADFATKLSAAITDMDFSTENLRQLRGLLLKLQSQVKSAKTGTLADDMVIPLKRSLFAIDNLLSPPSGQVIDVFSRPGSMPLSHGAGIEFTPGLNP